MLHAEKIMKGGNGPGDEANQHNSLYTVLGLHNIRLIEIVHIINTLILVHLTSYDRTSCDYASQ